METAIQLEKTRIQMFPEIKFNMDSCLGALDCGKCLSNCICASIARPIIHHEDFGGKTFYRSIIGLDTIQE